tara:strand:- start:181 stop:1266 length:1086 start_codon:yes stop_codon:yes gene_type:complete
MNEKIFVTTFSNHDQMGMRTQVFAASTGALVDSILDFGALTPATADAIDFGIVTGLDSTVFDRGNVRNDPGIPDISEKSYVLDRTPINSDYVFVSYNKRYLTANIDFRVEGKNVIIPRIAPSTTDTIVIHYVTENTVSQNALGYRIFKDILNRYHYRRISETHSTTLTQQLLPDDTEINVADPSVLPTPNTEDSAPGIIFIGKERIAYFEKDGNTLKRLFRGTLGTGIQTHANGTAIVDASNNQEIPYSDTTTEDLHTGDGSTVFFGTTFTPSDIDQLVVQVGGETSSAFSLGGDSTSGITFTTAPANGVQIRITKKDGNAWYSMNGDSSSASNGLGLQQSTTKQANFLKAETTNLDLILN